MSLKYTPAQLFVESSFFTVLLDRKLNEFKLDSSSYDIRGFQTPPSRLTRFNDRPIFNLDHASFDTESPSDGNLWFKGSLHNVNTIEEFRLCDKASLLRGWGLEIHRDILSGTSSRASLERFHVLTFCDLKKYRFYYWFAFPVLNSPWTVEKTSPTKESDSLRAYIGSHANEAFFAVVKGEYVLLERLEKAENGSFVFVDTCLGASKTPSVQLKNYLFLLAARGFRKVELLVYRSDGSFTCTLSLEADFDPKSDVFKVSGWERTAQGKLGPKVADLASLIDPKQLADQAVDLNLRLMKWRVAPDIDLDTIRNQKVLLLGAGTLGSYVARALMGWGVRNITFADSGRVLYSNPVRQPLFRFEDCFGDAGQGVVKAKRAAQALKEIFPGVDATGYQLEVPMVGHPVADEGVLKKAYEELERLVEAHDAVFLLMDSRESRWLPSLLGLAHNKVVINAALGFDSYLVMRHGGLGTQRLGCYFCNDVFAPGDSLSDRTLDQMCTVTRPGGAPMALALAVELFVAILQHPERNMAPAEATSRFGDVPHQIRGFLHGFLQVKLSAPAYKHCLACSEMVLEGYKASGWEFVRLCLNDVGYLEQVLGLKKVQEDAEATAAALVDELEIVEEGDEDEEWLL